MRKYISLLVLMVLFIFGVNAQEQKSKKEQRKAKKEAEYKQTLELITSHSYRFVANNATPIGGQTIDLTTNTNYLIISADSVEAYLPFFGRAYTASTYTDGGGIKFSTALKDYKVEPNDAKRTIQVNFSAKTEYDEFQCTLNVMGNGYANLAVNSRNRAFISYYGQVFEPKE